MMDAFSGIRNKQNESVSYWSKRRRVHTNVEQTFASVLAENIDECDNGRAANEGTHNHNTCISIMAGGNSYSAPTFQVQDQVEQISQSLISKYNP